MLSRAIDETNLVMLHATDRHFVPGRGRIEMIFGFGWGLVLLYVAVFVAVILYFLVISKGSEVGYALFFGAFIGAMLVALLVMISSVIPEILSRQALRTDVRTTPVVAMSNGQDGELSGSFFLGIGGFSTEHVNKYTYMAKIGQDVELQTIKVDEAEHVYVREETTSSVEPRIEVEIVQTKRAKHAWVPDWLWSAVRHPITTYEWSDDDHTAPTYRFFVPQGTVKYQFEVSVENAQ